MDRSRDGRSCTGRSSSDRLIRGATSLPGRSRRDWSSYRSRSSLGRSSALLGRSRSRSSGGDRRNGARCGSGNGYWLNRLCRSRLRLGRTSSLLWLRRFGCSRLRSSRSRWRGCCILGRTTALLWRRLTGRGSRCRDRCRCFERCLRGASVGKARSWYALATRAEKQQRGKYENPSD